MRQLFLSNNCLWMQIHWSLFAATGFWWNRKVNYCWIVVHFQLFSFRSLIWSLNEKFWLKIILLELKELNTTICVTYDGYYNFLQYLFLIHISIDIHPYVFWLALICTHSYVHDFSTYYVTEVNVLLSIVMNKAFKTKHFFVVIFSI